MLVTALAKAGRGTPCQSASCTAWSQQGHRKETPMSCLPSPAEDLTPGPTLRHWPSMFDVVERH